MLQLNKQCEFTSFSIRDSFSLPRNVVDVCQLGLTLNKVVFERLHPFKNRPISTRLKEVLLYLKSYYGKEQSLLTAWLNCEQNLHSGPGNVNKIEYISDEKINRLLRKDLNKIDNLIVLIDSRVARKEKCWNNTFAAWLDLRDSISFLYRKLARLYPDGSVRDALIEMADILDQNQDDIVLSNKLFIA